MTAEEQHAGHGDAECCDQQQEADRTRHALYFLSKETSTEPEQRRPEDSAKRVHEQEMAPGHEIGPGEDSGKRAQKGHEAPEEDNLAAMPAKQVLAHLEPAFVKRDVTAIATDQAQPDRPADQVAEIVSDDRRQSGDADDGRDVDM